MKEILTVGVIAFKDDLVLLVQSGKNSQHITGTWGLPAGRVESKEELQAAASREFQEETGLEVQVEDLVPLQAIFRADITRKSGIETFVWYLFVCNKFSGSLRGTQETFPKWVKIVELNTLHLLPNVAEAISEAELLRNEL